MPGRNAIAIDIGRQRLRAVLADCDRNRVTVKRMLVESVPDDLDVGDAKSVGTWAGQQLSSAGFPRTKAVIAVAREHVVLKRVRLPTADPRELPEMTRLAVRLMIPAAHSNEPDPLDIEAVVVRCEQAERSCCGDDRYTLALFFTRLDDIARERLSQFIDA